MGDKGLGKGVADRRSMTPIGSGAYLDNKSLPKGKAAARGVFQGKDVLEMKGVEVAVMPEGSGVDNPTRKRLSERRASKKMQSGEVVGSQAERARVEKEAERVVATGIVVREMATKTTEELRESPEFDQALRTSLGGEEKEGGIVEAAVWAVNEALDFGYGFVRSFFDQKYVNDVTGYEPPEDTEEVQEVFPGVYDAAVYAHEHVISPYVLEPAKQELVKRGTDWLRNKGVELGKRPDERSKMQKLKDTLKILNGGVPAAIKGQKAREQWVNDFLVDLFPSSVAGLLKTKAINPEGNNITAGIKWLCYGKTVEDFEKTKAQRHMLGVFLTNYLGINEARYSDKIMNKLGKYVLGVDVEGGSNFRLGKVIKNTVFSKAGAILGAVVPFGNDIEKLVIHRVVSVVGAVDRKRKKIKRRIAKQTEATRNAATAMKKRIKKKALKVKEVGSGLKAKGKKIRRRVVQKAGTTLMAIGEKPGKIKRRVVKQLGESLSVIENRKREIKDK